MLDSWINDVILALAGVLIGAIAFVGALLDPARDATPHFRRPGKGFFASVRAAEKENEQLRELAPRSYKIAIGAFAGAIAAFILAVIASPIEMNWLVFLGAVFGAMGASQAIFWIATGARLPNRRAEPPNMTNPPPPT